MNVRYTRSMSPTSSLHTYFGFDTFRAGQEEAIQSLLNHHHTPRRHADGRGQVAHLSICRLGAEGITLVISPLIALMKDQVDALHRRGIPATFINSAIPVHEQKERFNLHFAR